MAITISSGMRLTPARLNALAPLPALKTSAQSVTNSTTLTNDTELFIPAAANTVVAVKLTLLYSATTAGDIKISWAWPLGATFPWGILALDQGATTPTGSVNVSAFDAPSSGSSFFGLGGAGAGNTLAAIVAGTLTMGATPGNLQFQFAQVTAAAATSATVKAGSVILAQRVV